MPNGEFNPEYSSNSIYYDTNFNECLTAHIEDMESDIALLQTGKANTNHTHTEYAPIDHTHTGYETEGYVDTHINGKVDKVDGKELSSNDYTDAEKTKLAGVATGANNYTLPTAGSSLGGVKTTSTVSSNSGYTACPIIGGVPYYKDTNTTYDSLKNPYKLTLQFNGSTNKIYDGSSAQTFNVTPSAIGVADYIVATGTSGDWTYRKWNSGIMEQWAKVNVMYTWTTWSTWYEGVPTGVTTFGIAFAAAPNVTANCVSGTWGIPFVQNVTATNFDIYCTRPNAGTTTGYYIYSVYAIGRWK